jgi:hypothetical protein
MQQRSRSNENADTHTSPHAPHLCAAPHGCAYGNVCLTATSLRRRAPASRWVRTHGGLRAALGRAETSHTSGRRSRIVSQDRSWVLDRDPFITVSGQDSPPQGWATGARKGTMEKALVTHGAAGALGAGHVKRRCSRRVGGCECATARRRIVSSHHAGRSNG